MKGPSLNRLSRPLRINLPHWGELLYASLQLWPKESVTREASTCLCCSLTKQSQETGPTHPNISAFGQWKLWTHILTFAESPILPTPCAGVPQDWKTHVNALLQRELLQLCSQLEARHFPRPSPISPPLSSVCHPSISMTSSVTLQTINIISFLILFAVALFFAEFPKFLGSNTIPVRLFFMWHKLFLKWKFRHQERWTTVKSQYWVFFQTKTTLIIFWRTQIHFDVFFIN